MVEEYTDNPVCKKCRDVDIAAVWDEDNEFILDMTCNYCDYSWKMRSADYVVPEIDYRTACFFNENNLKRSRHTY